MSKRKECLAYLSSLRAQAKQSSFQEVWIASTFWPRNDAIAHISLAALVSLLLAACERTHFEPYDYDKREKAKLELPKDSKIELEGKRFILKKEFEFPYWSK